MNYNCYSSIDKLDLPIGVYYSDLNGRIIYANSAFYSIVGITKGKHDDVLLDDIYQDRALCAQYREQAIQLAEEGEYLESDIQLTNGKLIKDYCRTIIDTESLNNVGYLGCIAEIKNSKPLQLLFDRLPAIVYRLDANDRILQVNNAIRTLLGYDPNSLIGKPVSILYKDCDKHNISETAGSIRRKILDMIPKVVDEDGGIQHSSQAITLTNEAVILRKANGTEDRTFWANITPILKDGKYDGREGALTDITSEARLKKLLEYIPVGAYFINYEFDVDGNKREVIKDCNHYFAKEIFGFKNEDDARGTDVSEIWYDFKEAESFENLIEDVYPQAATTYVHVKRIHSADSFLSEVHAKAIRDEKGLTTGRSGAIRRADGEQELIHQIGSVFHEIKSLVKAQRSALSPAFLLLGENPFAHMEEIELIHTKDPLSRLTKQLITAIRKVLDYQYTDDYALNALSTFHWDELKCKLDVLENLERDVPDYAHRTTLQFTSIQVIEIADYIKKGRIANQIRRGLKEKAINLGRMCCIIQLYLARHKLWRMQAEVKELHAKLTSRYLFTQNTSSGNISPIRITTLIEKAVEDVAIFAVIKEVLIRRRYKSDEHYVAVNQYDIVTALYNILENAVKYSHHYTVNYNTYAYFHQNMRYVTIKTYADSRTVSVEVSNFGVAINPDDISTGLILGDGQRGTGSSERGRSGMGLGFPIANRIVKKYNGKLDITSDPTVPGSEKGDDVPHLTTVTMKLPLYGM